MVLLAGLAGCDAGLGEQVAALREQVEAQAEAQRLLRARIDQLEAELAREGAARREGDAAREAPPPAPTPTESPVAAPVTTFTPVCDAGTCTIPRAEVEALLADPAALAKAARLVPAMKDGKVAGFKLFGIRAGSPFAALGLQNGDTVTELGGVALTSVEAALGSYEALRKQARWVIRGTRKDGPLEITIAVK